MNIDDIKIGDSIIDDNGEQCSIKKIIKKGSLTPQEKTHQLLLFPLSLESQDNWTAEQEKYVIDKVFTNPQEDYVYVQHYPNKKFYDALIKCDKCDNLSNLSVEPIDKSKTQEKFICSSSIKVNENFYTCKGKKYTEIKRKYKGIPCVNIYTWENFIKKFKCEKY